MSPLDFELKDDVEPVCFQPYPVTKVHKDIINKEIEFVAEIGFLKCENDAKWWAPLFSHPKTNTSWVSLLNGFGILTGNQNIIPTLCLKKWDDIKIRGF